MIGQNHWKKRPGPPDKRQPPAASFSSARKHPRKRQQIQNRESRPDHSKPGPTHRFFPPPPGTATSKPPAWLALAGVTRDGDANWAAPFTRWHRGKRALRKNALGLPMASRRIPAVSSLDRSEPMDETGFTLKYPSPSATSLRMVAFGKMGTIQPLLCGVPLLSDSTLDWYITRVRPVHEAICRWLILSWVFAHVVSQHDQISLRMSQATSLVTRSDLIVKSSNDKKNSRLLNPALEADRTESTAVTGQKNIARSDHAYGRLHDIEPLGSPISSSRNIALP
ncbi:hypothetical protein CDEST_08627 [Colletotrichum destructivum]|uniref:Uncharacterized protein n=1 Tax=Colletotrichum destructivum TaxID=34406 RepID=A0AAX4IJD3_9PEZI|nr:hypothetical protein CDEST_08627 [Colletotrichum destructivum]